MSNLFTVTFTTKALVNKYDAKGKMIAQEVLGKPVTITALPYSAAMSYSKCDGFTIEPYVMEDRRKFTPKGTGRDASVGNGTKKVSYSRGEEVKTGKQLNTAGVGTSKVNQAAASGNLGAALNT